MRLVRFDIRLNVLPLPSPILFFPFQILSGSPSAQDARQAETEKDAEEVD
jgi:hypothetical protein